MGLASGLLFSPCTMKIPNLVCQTETSRCYRLLFLSQLVQTSLPIPRNLSGPQIYDPPFRHWYHNPGWPISNSNSNQHHNCTILNLACLHRRSFLYTSRALSHFIRPENVAKIPSALVTAHICPFLPVRLLQKA
jgi:hypothetical protein